MNCLLAHSARIKSNDYNNLSTLLKSNVNKLCVDDDQ